MKIKEKISKSLYGKFRGKESNAWKGGRIKHFNYILIYKPEHPFTKGSVYIYEHRLIVEKYIKRFLKSKETVHHINHDPSDNHPKNLMAFINHAIHNKFASGKLINSSDIIFDGRHI